MLSKFNFMHLKPIKSITDISVGIANKQSQGSCLTNKKNRCKFMECGYTCHNLNYGHPNSQIS